MAVDPLALAALAMSGQGGVTRATPVQGVSDEGAEAPGLPVLIGAVAVRARTPSAIGGSLQSPGVTNGRALITYPFGAPAQQWKYAAPSSGLVNTTTAVTIRAAPGGGYINFISSLSLMAEALTNATEFAIRDGAGGTVIWRIKIPTAGLPLTHINFPSPLVGSTALLEIVTLTASGAGAVYFNATGFEGSV